MTFVAVIRAYAQTAQLTASDKTARWEAAVITFRICVPLNRQPDMSHTSLLDSTEPY